MRPKQSFAQAVKEAFRKGYQAGRQSLPAMLAIEAVMALVVGSYYLCPPVAAALSRLADWQHAGGVLAAACASAFAGGILSEISAVYFLDGGRWTRAHLDNAAFKAALFFVTGAIVYEFYYYQSVWFGNGAAWSIILPKIIVDQCGYTPFFSVPFQTVVIRWHHVGYSFRRLGPELNRDLVTGKMLPVLVTNWMFWVPGVTFIYSMPQNLQMPLAILANAIWSILLSAAARPSAALAPDQLVMPGPGAAPQSE